MNPKTIIPYGWDEIKADTGSIAYDHPEKDLTILALNTTPLRNYIPLLTSSKITWEVSLVNTETEEVKFQEEYHSQSKAIHALQDYLEENPVE